MTSSNTPLEKRKFKEVVAKKAKECRLCPNNWNEGDKIFIMSDPFTDTFELVCIECRERVANSVKTATTQQLKTATTQQATKNETLETPKNDNLKLIHTELKKVLARLEKLMESPEEEEEYDFSDC